MWAASCLGSCFATCASHTGGAIVSGIGELPARFAYCFLFALSLLALWLPRYLAPLLEKIPWIDHFLTIPDREWFETDAVLRASLANFLFYSILAIVMIGVKEQNGFRDRIHRGGWKLKILSWCILAILTFILPDGVISFYKATSKFGSGLFLFVQVLHLLDFVYRWNDKWVGYNTQRWYIALLAVTLVCYVATFSFSGLLFYLFTPSGHDCGLNTFFIVMALIFVFVFTVVTLHPAVGGSILSSSVISLYCMYLCYSGLAREPRDYECNGLHNHSKTVSSSSLALGLSITVLSLVYSAYSNGSSTSLFSSPPSSPRTGSRKPLLPLDKSHDDDDDDDHEAVSYSYPFFYLTFALASMYSVMLFTGWSTFVGESGKLVDVGWPSVWVRIVTSWATAALFIWTLVAPILFPNRVFQ